MSDLLILILKPPILTRISPHFPKGIPLKVLKKKTKIVDFLAPV